MMIEKIAKKSLEYFGYDIKGLKGSKYSAEYLSKLCNPGTVFDVGVGYGTYELYNAFPDSHFVLVEPLKVYESSISKISQQYNCDIYFKAVSENSGKITIRVPKQHPQRSSFESKQDIIKTDDSKKKVEVEVTTLDDIYDDLNSVDTPILLKLDIEGHEIKALKGGSKLISNAEYIITEVSIAKRYNEGYSFDEMVKVMKENGFRLFSILEVCYVEDQIEPHFADLVFKSSS